jgi:hypothetical protein
MSQLYSGFGKIVLLDRNTAIPGFLLAELIAFKVNTNSSEIVSYKMVCGRKVPAGAKQGLVERTCQITIEAVNRAALELALGVRSAISASLDLVELRYKRVPLSGAFEIVDLDIGTALGVQAYVVEKGVWGDAGSLTLLASGSPATGQFKVDGTNNKIVFNAAQAGATIAYALIKNYTGLRTIGKEQGAAQLNNIKLEGLLFTDSGAEFTKIVIPSMSGTKAPSLDFGEKLSLEIEYRMLVAQGEESDHYLVEMPAGYVAC